MFVHFYLIRHFHNLNLPWFLANTFITYKNISKIHLVTQFEFYIPGWSQPGRLREVRGGALLQGARQLRPQGQRQGRAVDSPTSDSKLSMKDL